MNKLHLETRDTHQDRERERDRVVRRERESSEEEGKGHCCNYVPCSRL